METGQRRGGGAFEELDVVHSPGGKRQNSRWQQKARDWDSSAEECLLDPSASGTAGKALSGRIPSHGQSVAEMSRRPDPREGREAQSGRLRRSRDADES